MIGAVALTVDAGLHAAYAAIYAVIATLILIQGRQGRSGTLLAVACLMSAAWAGSMVFLDGPSRLGAVPDALDLLRLLTWYGFLLVLFRRSMPERNTLLRAFVTMGLIAALMAALIPLLNAGVNAGAPADAQLPVVEFWSVGVAARLALAVCNILLIENLWRNTPSDQRWHVILPCVALGALFVYDVLMTSDAVLFRRGSFVLREGRALAGILAAPLIAVGAARNRRWQIDLHVSRDAVFHSATLVASGVFFLSLAAVGEVFRQIGGDWGGVAEVAMLFAGILVIGVLVTSGSARSRLRGIVVDHFFTHRYDYRREWVRCIETLSAPDDYVPLHLRAIRAVAEVVDSPGGALFLRDGVGMPLRWSGSWNLPPASHPVTADHPLLARLSAEEGVVQVGSLAGADELPEPMIGAWIAVSLVHAGEVTGCVVLVPPRVRFSLDVEVLALLRTVGREVASYIAEQRMTEVLTQTRQLHEYGKRFAFVAHDIKNLSSQLSLLLANAEHHIQNPAFQKDMLATVRSSVQKISALLKRLQEPERDLAQNVVTPADRIASVVAGLRRTSRPEIVVEADGWTAGVAMTAASFDAVIGHLLTNAIEASPPDAPVHVRVGHEGRRLVIDIVDQGAGMTAEFVRDDLFRPFATSKRDGTGIGVFQSRELLRAAGGDLIAISKPGHGTTMRLSLPVVRVAEGETVSVLA